MGNKLYMAPILGISNCIYRNIFDRLFNGYDYAMAPFISACNVETVNSKVLKDLFPERNSASFKIIPQLIGKDAKDFISVARAIYDLGYETVNWNLGCPLKKVRNKKRGSGLLPYPDEIVSLLETIISAIPNKISIKVRLGCEKGDELFKLLPMLDELPLEDITIHPRTASQMYSGQADIDAFEKALGLTKHKVIYNGDIYSTEDFSYLSERFPQIKDWMIGRGGIINPFLTEEIKELRVSDASEKIIRFRELHYKIFEAYQLELDGPAHLLAKMKEHWYYWSQAFVDSRKKMLTLARTKDLQKYQEQVNLIFSDDSQLLIV